MYIDINMIEKAREMFLIVAVDSLLPAAVSYILSHIWNRGRQKIPGIFDKCRRIGKCKSKVYSSPFDFEQGEWKKQILFFAEMIGCVSVFFFIFLFSKITSFILKAFFDSRLAFFFLLLIFIDVAWIGLMLKTKEYNFLHNILSALSGIFTCIVFYGIVFYLIIMKYYKNISENILIILLMIMPIVPYMIVNYFFIKNRLRKMKEVTNLMLYSIRYVFVLLLTLVYTYATIQKVNCDKVIEWLIFISVFSCFIEYIYKDIKSIKFTDCEIVRENDSRIKAYGNIYEIEAGRILYRTEPEQYVVEKQEGVKYIIGKWKIKEIRKQIIKKYPDIYNGEFWVFEFKISKHWGYFKGFQENTVYAIVIRNELINEIKYDEKNGKAWINGKSLQSFFTSIS